MAVGRDEGVRGWRGEGHPRHRVLANTEADGAGWRRESTPQRFAAREVSTQVGSLRQLPILDGAKRRLTMIEAFADFQDRTPTTHSPPLGIHPRPGLSALGPRHSTSSHVLLSDPQASRSRPLTLSSTLKATARLKLSPSVTLQAGVLTPGGPWSPCLPFGPGGPGSETGPSATLPKIRAGESRTHPNSAQVRRVLVGDPRKRPLKRRVW